MHQISRFIEGGVSIDEDLKSIGTGALRGFGATFGNLGGTLDKSGFWMELFIIRSDRCYRDWIKLLTLFVNKLNWN